MGVKRCSWGTCNADSRYPDRYPGVCFIAFAKPKTHPETCLRWIKACGRPHSQLNMKKISRYTFICSRHFVDGKPTKESPDPISARTYASRTVSRRKVPKQRSARPPTLATVALAPAAADDDDADAATAADGDAHAATAAADNADAAADGDASSSSSTQQLMEGEECAAEEAGEGKADPALVLEDHCYCARQPQPSAHTPLPDPPQSNFSDMDAAYMLLTLKEQESPWSMKEEPQDQPSAVYSTVQPMSDNTSGSLLSHNASQVCQHCSATFVLFSSLELHMVTFHGETLHDSAPLHSGDNKRHDVGYDHGSKTENAGDRDNQKAVKRRKEKVEDGDTDRTDHKKKSREHVCDLCGKAFLKAYHLKTHKLIHSGLKPFVCDVCSKAFTQAGHLTEHKLIHTGHKPFVCNLCGRAFTRAYHLKTHMLIHTGDKPFVCNVCSKSFTKAGDLKRHMMIHSGHKPFVCDMCCKAFAEAGNLKKHRLVHADQKPFVCDVCDKTFIHSCALKKHKMVHIQERIYRCPHCATCCNDSGGLLKHIGSVHAGDRHIFEGKVTKLCAEKSAEINNSGISKPLETDRLPEKQEAKPLQFTYDYLPL